jgi:hypothetical protein
MKETTMAGNAVLCIAKSEQQADKIVTDLRGAGFPDGDISVLLPDKKGTRDFAHEKGTKMPEGAATGAATGSVVGGTLGLLAGIGALAIPGVGPLIAAGPIMAALSGAAAGAAAGGLTGALVGLGIPEYEAKQYESKVKGGNLLISVHTDDSAQRSRAKEIFTQDKAEDIASTGEARAH